MDRREASTAVLVCSPIYLSQEATCATLKTSTLFGERSKRRSQSDSMGVPFTGKRVLWSTKLHLPPHIEMIKESFLSDFFQATMSSEQKSPLTILKLCREFTIFYERGETLCFDFKILGF